MNKDRIISKSVEIILVIIIIVMGIVVYLGLFG